MEALQRQNEQLKQEMVKMKETMGLLVWYIVIVYIFMMCTLDASERNGGREYHE